MGENGVGLDWIGLVSREMTDRIRWSLEFMVLNQSRACEYSKMEIDQGVNGSSKYAKACSTSIILVISMVSLWLM